MLWHLDPGHSKAAVGSFHTMLRPFLGSWFSLALILDTTAPVWQAPQPTHTSSYLELPALPALPFLTVLLEQPALSEGSPLTTCPF